MKTVLVFQGGGALGAFGCGAWKCLSHWLRRSRHQVVALAGSSIGALNAAVIAHHAGSLEDGVEALESLWRNRIATPSFPFFGWVTGDAAWSRRIRSWNGLMSGLLIGNRGLYTPQFGTWNPWDGMRRLQRPLYDPRRMRELLATETPGYTSHPADGSPLLAVTATELMRGELHLFDSDAGGLGPSHLLASAAIPLLFEPVPIGDGLYWDGDMVRPSLMATLVARVRASGRAASDEPLQLVTIEQFPQPLKAPPLSGVEIAYRVFNLLQVEKLDPAELGPPPGFGRAIRITRAPLEHDGISGQFDYSPERIGELIEQGEATAREALDISQIERAPDRPLPSSSKVELDRIGPSA
jgi:NTE family protein